MNTAEGQGTSTRYGVGALGRYYAGRRAVESVRGTRFFVESSVSIEGYNPEFGDNTNGMELDVGPGIA